MGIPYDDVIDKVHMSGDNSGLSHLHLVTKQDLTNIARDFSIHTGAQLSANDADSVAAWVELQRVDG